jgi:hypothetical protein
MAGFEFTNGDQPGVRLTKAAAARTGEQVNASRSRSVRKLGSDKLAKPTGTERR